MFHINLCPPDTSHNLVGYNWYLPTYNIGTWVWFPNWTIHTILGPGFDSRTGHQYQYFLSKMDSIRANQTTSYKQLWDYYLKPTNRENEELPSGMILWKRRALCNLLRFKNSLFRQKLHTKILRLEVIDLDAYLCQLWHLCPNFNVATSPTVRKSVFLSLCGRAE